MNTHVAITFECQISGAAASLVIQLSPKHERAVRNFICNATSHNRSHEQRTGLLLGAENSQPEPLYGSRAVRVEPDMIEFGTSPTSSVFGGYFEDEHLGDSFSGAAACSQGSLLMSNHGPNTNGSRYVILLKDMPELRWQHVCFGRTVSGMDELINLVRLHCQRKKRGDANHARRVVITEVHIERKAGAPRDLRPQPRLGKVRPREEETADDCVVAGDIASASRGEAATAVERAAKRHRVESAAEDNDRLAPMAIPTEEGAKFDLFAAQQRCFASDLAAIGAVQSVRRLRHSERKGRALHFAAKSRKKRCY